MGIAKMLLRILQHIILIIVLLIFVNFLVYFTFMLKKAIGEYSAQIIISSVCFTVFMIVNYIRIYRDHDLHRDITAGLNKAFNKPDKEYNMPEAFGRFMLKDGFKEIICFMAALGLVNVFYLGIKPDVPNVMNDVFMFLYNVFKFIYSPDAPLGVSNNYMTANYFLTVGMFIIGYSLMLIPTISKCEQNRLHKN